MPSFNDVIAGSSADSSCVQQIIDSLKGSAGKGIPISVTAVNDSVNWAVDVRNQEAVNSRAFRASRANGTVLIQADVNGVQVSSTGGAPATVVNISDAQTLTNKTLTSPVLNGTLSGTGTLGAWSSWAAPAITQGGDTPTFSIQQASYTQFGKDARVQLNITFTSTGTLAQQIQVSTLPIAPRISGGFVSIGHFLYDVSGGTIYVGEVVPNTTAIAYLLASANTGAYFGQTNGPSIAIAVGDRLSLNLSYEST